MNEPNPYLSPDANVSVPSPNELAGRWSRLGAVFVDGLIALPIILPLMYVGGYFTAAIQAAQLGQQVGLGTTMLWTLIGIAVFCAVQAYPLYTTGQTWGKKALGIRIVDMEGNKPDFARLLGLRYVLIQLISAIPVLGMLFALVNALFIFGESRRCVHDLIAGTRVIRAD